MAISRVSAVHNSDYVGSVGNIASPAQSHTTGNMLLVSVRWFFNAAVTYTVTDTAGNEYRLIGRSTRSSSSDLSVFICNNCTGNASNVVTATFSTNVIARSIMVVEYSGLTVTTPVLDAAPSIVGEATGVGGGSTTVTSKAFSTLVDDELIVMIAQIDNLDTTWTAPSGFTTAVQDARKVVYIADRVVTAVQSAVTVTVTNSNTQNKDFLLFTFVADGATVVGGGGGSPGGSPGGSEAVETGFATVGG